MTDAELMLTVEARKKSGWIAAILNLFIPGGGYFYCGNWVLGIIAIGMLVAAFILMGVVGFFVAGTFQLMFIIDGFLCAGRHNKNMINKVLKENRAIKVE